MKSKADRGLAQIRRDWLDVVHSAQEVLANPPTLPAPLNVPEWTGEGDGAFAILVHPREYCQDGTWKPIEQVAEPEGKCKVMRDDSYKFSDASDDWADVYPAWRNSLADLEPLAEFEFSPMQLWMPMHKGFDRAIWQPGRVRVDQVETIAAAFATEVETIIQWRANWVEYLIDSENHGGGLVGEESTGALSGVYGCGAPPASGTMQIYVPSGRPGDPTGAGGWGEFKARIETVQEELGKVPPACGRAVKLLDDLQQAIRPFRHGTHYRFRGE